MSVQVVDFVSRAVAESLLFLPDTAIISITDPGKRVAMLPVWFRRVLRLSFYDAVPGDEFIPIPVPGCFDLRMAQDVREFIDVLIASSTGYRLLVHCEEGVSRSAAVALFAAEYAGAHMPNRDRAFLANPWVVEQLSATCCPSVEVRIPTDSGDRKYANQGAT